MNPLRYESCHRRRSGPGAQSARESTGRAVAGRWHRLGAMLGLRRVGR